LPNADEEVPVEIGDVLAGKYRVERVLGVGGMGVVVAARHIDLNEMRAVKFLRRDAQDAETVGRFMREARAVVRLRSPHVVQVYDVGRFDSGEPYIVMEYLEGEDLKAVLARGERLPVQDCVDITLQALEAMAEAHAAGIVHRDVKPANLYLVRDRDGGICVKVVDFGISKLLEPDNPEGMEMTSTHALMGSPYYMSPEQMMSTRDVDERTDIWSIGVVLYQLLTGSVPFRGKNIAAQCALLLQHDPSPPSERVSTAMPAGLDAAVLEFLRREPQARFQDTAAAARALVPFGGPHADRTLRRIERALRGAMLDQSSDGYSRLSRPSGSGVAAAVSHARVDANARTQSDKMRRGHSEDPLDIGTDPTLTSASGQQGEDDVPVATPSAGDLEAAVGLEMSQSTKASWQTKRPPPTLVSRRTGLMIGAALAVVGGGVLALVFHGGSGSDEAAAPASTVTAPIASQAAPPTSAAVEPTTEASASDGGSSDDGKETAAPPSAEPSSAEPSSAEPSSAEPPPSKFPSSKFPSSKFPPSKATPLPPSTPSPPPDKPPPAKADPFGTGRK